VSAPSQVVEGASRDMRADRGAVELGLGDAPADVEDWSKMRLGPLLTAAHSHRWVY
jgi:hypothetical protein